VSKLKENKTKYVILGFLNHEEMSGYDIKQRVDNSIKMFWPVRYGQIYPTLKKLEQDGMINHCKSTYEFGPERKIFEITKVGQAELKKWLKKPIIKEDMRYEILVKLFFAGSGEKKDIIKNILDFKNRYQEQLSKLQYLSQNLESVLGEHEDHRFFFLTAQFGIKTYHSFIEWADDAIEFLKENKGDESNG